MKALFAIFALSAMARCQSPEAVRWADYWAQAYGIEKELVYAVIEAESGWNSRAVSRSGAAGLMQLMPDTAAALGVTNRFDVVQNLRGGVAYLAELRRLCGNDWRLIVASYNAGPNVVCRRRLQYASPEVTSYVMRVAHFYRRNLREAILQRGETR